MNSTELEQKLNDLILTSLQNKRHKEQITFDLSESAIQKAWKKKFIDLRGYQYSVHSDEVRHIYKEHGDDVYLVSKIHYMLDKFYFIEKSTSYDKKSGRNLPCLVFKNRQKASDIKIVKVHYGKNKILSLKTLFDIK